MLPWGAADPAAATLGAVLDGTPDAMRAFLPAGEPTDELCAGLTGGQAQRVTILGGVGDPAGRILNAAAHASPGADLILITGPVGLPDGWLAKLQEAAWTDDAVAAATTFADGPGPPLLAGFGHAAGGSAGEPGRATQPPPIHPRVLWPWSHCAWLRRPVVDLVGGFDESLAHPGAVLAEFGARALAHGLSCTVADDVCARRSEDGPGRWPESDRRGLLARHPWIQAALDDQAALDPGPLRRSIAVARSARVGISVTVDARALGPGVGGTQTYVAALVVALARSERLTVRAMVAADAPVRTTDAFAAAGAEIVTYEQAVAGVPRTDIVHRPQQVFTPHDLRLLQMVGDRIVVSQMDLISYRNPTYHATIDAWRVYRRVTHLALAVADQTVFFSEHSRREAIAEELVEPERTAVVGIGVEPPPDGEEDVRPPAVPPDRELLLVLGADYTHKNRPFAMAMADELRRRHGWEGLLVLAGPHQPYGSSATEEQAVLLERPELTARVLDVGMVSEPEKRWLISTAQAQILASNHEGFGLIPLESAAADRPCIYAPRTSLKEIIDPAAATIVPWDVTASADAAAALLRDGDVRARHLDLLSQALARYTWDDVVVGLRRCYEAAITSSYRGAASRVWDELQREELIMALDAAHDDLQDRVGYGQALIDRRGGLLSRAEQRGLLRVASRPWLRRPLLAPFGALGADEREQPDLLGDRG